MMKSMTGFGKATCEINGKIISAEVKSLNSKGLDLTVKLPFSMREKEQIVRTEIAPTLERGKIECLVHVEEKDDGKAFSINRDIAKKYYLELKRLCAELGSDELPRVNAVLSMPEVLQKDPFEPGEQDWELIHATILRAVEQLDQFRTDEGLALKKDLVKRINHILIYLKDVEPLEEQRMVIVRERLLKNLEAIRNDHQIDTNRFEQELFYYLEKLDINEEKTRLKKHCDYFLETTSEPLSGKKLGFIGQEIGREINTLGSKANNAAIQKLVVQMKDELEKIKEQLLNVL